MTKRELSGIVTEALQDAGYEGGVSTWSRKTNGHDHTMITNPSDGAFEYLGGYLLKDAEVMQHPTTKTITIRWKN